jgi:SAM-dependent methyltransferase
MDDAASFRGSAAAYDRHVGRYSSGLARALIAGAGIRASDRVLDVGCGPGALTAELAAVVGADRVSAVDPSPDYLAACLERTPGIDAHVASGESLPFAGGTFDAVLSQLVVNFLTDARVALREMRRVTRPAGVIGAAVWDYAGEMWLLRHYWDAARTVDEQSLEQDEGTRMPYSSPSELDSLFRDAGLSDVATQPLVVAARYDDFDDLWDALAAGGGPASAHYRSLGADAQSAMRERMYDAIGCPAGTFELTARAWSVIGRA